MITNVENKNKIDPYIRKGFKFFFIKSLKNKSDFIRMFQKIYKIGYSRVFFETGLTFLNSLLYYKLVNNLYVLKNNINLNNNGFNNSTSKYLKNIRLINKIKTNLINDSLYKKEF